MIDIAIILLAVLGVLLCLKIHKKKKSPKPLVCPLGADCDSVLKSEFSTLFGVGLEIYGFMYYGIIAAAYAAALLVPSVHAMPMFYSPLVLLSVGAFLFSVYLTCLQAFKIRSWCTWCLTSALLSTLILTLSLLRILA